MQYLIESYWKYMPSNNILEMLRLVQGYLIVIEEPAVNDKIFYDLDS
jgi:hypothetical protein